MLDGKYEGKWIFDYNGGLCLDLCSEETESFCGSAFYKLSLKRYVCDISGRQILFKSALTYLDYKKIIAICKKEAGKRCCELEVTTSLADYIDTKELYIQTRAKLGVELKRQDEKLHDRFEEYRAVVDALMARKLRNKQMWDSFFMCAMQKSGNFSVPGSGKTSSVLGMYAYLKAKGYVKRIVVICPKNAFGSWIDEFGICFEGKDTLRLFNIHVPFYKNSAEIRRALKYDSGQCNLFLFNYESVGTYRDEIISLIDPHTLLAYDEIHKVKRIAGEYAFNAITIAKNAVYAVAMTGTPIPNSYTDIYNLLHILFPDEYKEFFNFGVGMLRNPSSDEMNEVNDKLQPFFCRTTKQQLAVPSANNDSILMVTASDAENKLFDILRMKYRKNKLALMIRILQMESDPKLLLRSLDLSDFCYILDDGDDIEDIDYADYSDEVKALIDTVDMTTKTKHCLALITDLASYGKPTVVWCIFIDSIKRLSYELEMRGIRTRCIYGEVPLEERQQIMSDFRNGVFKVLLTNPHTLAESVSLHSICHDAVYFEYSYNLVHLLQSKDRIHRLGLPDGQYTQYHYMQSFYDYIQGGFSMDEQIYLRLMEKEQTMLNAIDKNMLETMPTSDEDLDLIFAKLF